MVTLIVVLFIAGYLFIAFEKNIGINKAAFSLLTGVLCWLVYISCTQDKEMVGEQLAHHLSDISGIVFFLLGAMAIVELIDSHNGFDVIVARITTNDKRKLLWIISLTAFFLSAVLDNLTTAIVMSTLCRKLISDKQERMYALGIVIIAANAGGAWSPIGDVTTTMLWIGNRITALHIMTILILPSLVCVIVPTFLAGLTFKGELVKKTGMAQSGVAIRERNVVFFSGIGILVLVPVFKNLSGLPPYMGMLLGLSLLWLITEILHRKKEVVEKEKFTVSRAIQRTDVPSILFFFGILAAIAVLETTGTLRNLALWLDNTVGNEDAIAVLIGFASSVVDNVPLVAASMGMYDYPTDHSFWEFIAYCTGTGGSCLIIGSAAGVAIMGMEDISFGWFLKKISWLALIGYLAGAGIYLLQTFFR